MLGAFLFLFIISMLIALSSSPYVKGKLGEYKVSSFLQKHLKPPTYRVLNDITIPSQRGTTQIDHIVVSPYGIFVLETKNFKGRIFGNNRDQQWTQTTPGNKSRFVNPIRQNYGHIKSLEALTGLSESAFHSILVFVGSAKFKTSMPDEVCNLRNLVERVKLKGKTILSPEEMASALLAIKSGRLEPGFKTDLEHVRHLGERFEGSVQKGVSQGVSQGIKQLVVAGGVKLIGIILVIAMGIFAFNHLQNTIRNLSVFKQIPEDQNPRVQIKQPDSVGATSLFQANRTGQSNPHTRQKTSNDELAKVSWETTLRCGYSIDTNRCSCLNNKGIKVNVELERCKELATGKEN